MFVPPPKWKDMRVLTHAHAHAAKSSGKKREIASREREIERGRSVCIDVGESAPYKYVVYLCVYGIDVDTWCKQYTYICTVGIEKF